MVRLALACLLVLAWAQGAAAERRAALVFGADQYRSLRPLRNANGDAEAIRSALEALGFTVALEEDRTLQRMRRALDDFAGDAAGADVALVFFSGHGVEIAGDNRLLPVDADASSLASLHASTLPLEEVRTRLAATAKVGLVVLDACRADPFGAGTGEGRGAKALAPEVERGARPGLGRVGRAENILFAFSAAPGETASDGTGPNSPFTAALTKYLATDGLEIRSVLTLVQQAVYDETRGRQLPYVESGLPRTFFAAAARERLPERERLLLAMAEVTPALRDEVEQVAAGQDMPLAPLYGALIGADLASLSGEERAVRLAEAASAFTATRDALRRLASADPAVTRLRGEAENSLALGAFAQARALLAQAVDIDAQASDALAGNLVERRLSEAASHVAAAGVARAQLDYPGAIAALERAAALHARVEGENLSDQARRDRNWLLSDLGELYLLAGDTSGALDAFERMRQAAELLLAQAREGTDAERDLLASQLRIGDVKQAQGDLAGALGAYQASFDIARKLADGHPDSFDMQRDLSVGLNKLGEVKAAQGDLSGALASFQADLAIAEQLARAAPGNATLQRDVLVSRLKIGEVMAAQGDLPGALAVFQTGLEIAERLAESDPGNSIWQRDLSVVSTKIGEAKAAKGDLEGALASYRADLAITERLAQADPGNAGLRRDLSVSRQKVGEVLKRQGDLSGALAAFEAALELSERLAGSDPGNTTWQRDVSICLTWIGTIKVALDDLPGALAAYRGDLDISRRLAESDPGNAGWQRDLVVSHVRLADLGEAPREHLGAALRIVLALQARGALAATDAGLAQELEDGLAALPPEEP